jgi:hypothetical protein
MILLSASHYNDHKHLSHNQFLANFIMSEDQTEEKSSVTKEWGSSMKKTKALFKPDEFDIFCDKDSGLTYIFHIPELGCTIDFMEYDPETQHVTVFTTDGQKMDLGMRIQWLIRPYFARAQEIFVIRTENGKPQDGIEVALRIKAENPQKTLN